MPAPIDKEYVQLFGDDIPDDVATALIAGTWARALKIAPCLADMEWTDDDTEPGWANTQLVKDILRDAILRRDEAGTGVVGSRVSGDYQETLKYSGGLFRPSEIADLQQLCSDYKSSGRATTHLTIPEESVYVQHADWCSINFGGTLCDCGAELTQDGLPLWHQ